MNETHPWKGDIPMKKIIALALALCLCMGLAAPALAETAPVDMEAALTAVTAQVKDTLRVDDDYTDFYGDFYDDLVPTWLLNWSDEDRSLSVTCDETGKITDVYAYTYTDTNDRFYGFDPAFPALSAEDARALAEEWLARFMGEGESARIDSQSATLGADGNYRYYGTILLNGLESPITFTIRIDQNGLRSYSRSDGYNPYVGEIPAAEAQSGQLSAAVHLAGAVDMELYYITDEATGEARLQYVPVGAYTVVDAQTGEVVDMDALYESFQESGYGMSTMEAAAAEAPAVDGAYRNTAGLSEMELASISSYGDVLNQEELDSLLRVIKALGITEDFEIVRCSYSMDSETGDVTASLRYSAPMTEQELYGYSKSEYEQYVQWGESLTIYKYVTVNAKTGELVSLSTSYPLWERDPGEWDPDDLEKSAGEFLNLCAREMYLDSALCTLSGYDGGDGLTYARVQSGYFFPENYLYVEMNPATGTVDTFRYVWDEDVSFASARGIVSASDAAAAYVDALDVTLGYVAWPEEIRADQPELLRYAEWGYTWVESLRLAYYFNGLDEVAGVDALTGAALVESVSEAGAYVYNDLAASESREAIEALGQAGIGFEGGQFQPSAILTQRDAVTLLLQAAGYDVTGWEDEALGREAEYMGFIEAGMWKPDTTVTRMAFVKMILRPSRYGDTAELQDIWVSDFSDVTEMEMGYAAIAKGLGLVTGTAFEPAVVCTRAMAADFLYAFMSR